MPRGEAAGVPLSFKCRMLARIWPRESSDYAAHRHALTGRHRKASNPRGSHPRTSFSAFEWLCSCGASGWSKHGDLERLARRSFSDEEWSKVVERAPAYRREGMER